MTVCRANVAGWCTKLLSALVTMVDALSPHYYVVSSQDTKASAAALLTLTHDIFSTLVKFRPKMCLVRFRKRHVTLSKWHKLRLPGQSHELHSSWYSSKWKVCHLLKPSNTLTCCLMPKGASSIWMGHQRGLQTGNMFRNSFGECLLHTCCLQYIKVISMTFSLP